MKIKFDYEAGSEGWDHWVYSDHVPRIGDEVLSAAETSYTVRDIQWYPWGVDIEPEPFVIVVIR